MGHAHRKVLCLVIVLALGSMPRPVAAALPLPPADLVLVSAGPYQHLRGSGALVVWEEYHTPTQGAIFVTTLTVPRPRELDPDPAAIRDQPDTNGRVVIWREAGAGGQSLIRAVNLEHGQVFAVTSAAGPIELLAISGDTVVWSQDSGSGMQIMARDIGTLAPAVPVATGGQITWLAVTGTYVAWTELRDDTSRLFGMSLGDAHPQLLAEQVSEAALAGEQIVYAGPRGLVARQLADGSEAVIDASATQIWSLTTDGSLTCWVGAAPQFVMTCVSALSARPVSFPFSSGLTPDLQLSGGALLWLSHDVDPHAPATIYAATLHRLLGPLPAGTPAIGPAAFQQLWLRQDRPVAAQLAARSWTWGPGPISTARYEPFAQGVHGQRVVQYFDKSRMEINDPHADPGGPWYVTNGLLPIELITGRMQTGLNRFDQRPPAAITAIGDPGTAFPTYADLAHVYKRSDPGQPGMPATALLMPDGVDQFTGLMTDTATFLQQGPNGYLLPQAFASFLRQSGPVSDHGVLTAGQLYDPLFVFGLPVTAAYWAQVSVGGRRQFVLFQVFERRVLTYTPAHPPAFRVEMGNVGQHYVLWRYGQPLW